LVRQRAPRRRDRGRGLRGGGAARARAVSPAVDLSAEGRRRIAAVTGGRLPALATVAAGTLSLSCLVWGEGEPTAVLLHGNGGNAHWWDALVPGLLSGWRLVAPDLRGHGESDWAEPPRYAVADFAGDLDAVLAALAPEPVALVGHSMGARVALWYTAHHPDRVRALALLDTRTSPVDPGTAARALAVRGRPGARAAVGARAAPRCSRRSASCPRRPRSRRR